MPTHKISQGEHVTAIARANGFADGGTVWMHPDNAELRQSRKHAHVLAPGDILTVPEAESKSEAAATDQVHTFRLKASPLVIRLAMIDYDDDPISGVDCTLQVEFATHAFTTDKDGRIEQPIPHDAKTGGLIVAGVSTPLKIGHLDPIDLPSGQRARFNNLGIYAGEMADEGSEEATELLRSAIEEFQCDHSLSVDGICGPKTQAELEKVHGY